ncbi:extracellular catalytic domain type 1 short-chain-length polyhydroxyalkanoate depolymerase [Pseudorhodoferax soli]|uniref:Poly(Hydroxyalkanoate) depolymerase family esterase n=1 Tax=Pseudorhodoferax soli TaxID=545864 RepID=A0A368XLK3_9BURK|nr:PHB depolymerase family esterase [Pseudorhodoferax soli]RCW68872.1 poly(hydroxyalkanoate) depolymerase family esterase [Pseudorhodoferax soli]
MKHLFTELFGDATRLTQGGQLQAATDLIHRTLRDAGLAGAAPRQEPPDPRNVIDAESRVIADEVPPDAAARHAHEASPAAEQWLDGSFSHRGRTVAYKLYVPPTAAGAVPAPRPLLVMLHGCTQDADDFAAGTRMNQLARAAGMLVLYPVQTQHANAQKCWNWFKPQHQRRDQGEPALLAALTREVMGAHAVDAARVYVAGLSAGGAMADILGRHHADLFAAVGVHSGLPLGAASDLPSALAAMRSGPAAAATADLPACPVIVFHGDADSTVHPANGAAVARAGQQHGQPDITKGRAPNGKGFTHTVYRGADGSSQVEHWLLHGLGHAWSGGSAQGSYTAPGGVDASAEMLRFLLSHRRP